MGLSNDAVADSYKPMLHLRGNSTIPGMHGSFVKTHVPDIIEFCLSDKYLNKGSLYPRQATLLKTIFLQDELFTPYDFDVLGEWADGFQFPSGAAAQQTDVDGDPEALVTTMHYMGDWGINPDVLERIKLLKSVDAPWFNTVCAVQGRRSGKGHIGAIAGAYVLWHYMCLGDPKENFGIDPAKRLSCQVFAGKKAQARDNQWRDIANTLLGAPCFDEFSGDSLVESMTMLAPFDRARAIALRDRGKSTQMDPSTFEIVPKEATTMAARGPASFMQFYDEMAHMVNTGVSRSAEEVWNSATPALDQFREWSFKYCGSSPWTMMGKFYDLVQESLEIDANTYQPINPTILTIQLASWDIYVDWEKTKNNDMVAAPARRRTVRPYLNKQTGKMEDEVTLPTNYFQALKNAIQTYDAKMKREERLNPATFAVERRAKWATAQDAYLPLEHVRRAFLPWNGLSLPQLDQGQPGVHNYAAHADPGKTGSNFGFAIAHTVPDPDGSDIPHVVFDRVHAWTPGDFPTEQDNGVMHYEMDYIQVEEGIRKWAEGFLFSDLSFDQWNSISFVQRFAVYLNTVSYKPSQVWERGATAPLNWATAETFKMALALNRVHLPYLELAELELMFLRKLNSDKVDHPDSGPVTTKDVYDAISIVVHKLIGSQIASAYGEQFSALKVGVALPGTQQQQANATAHGGSGGPPGSSRPLGDQAVQSLFNRDRDARGLNSRPVPGQLPGRTRPRR